MENNLGLLEEFDIVREIQSPHLIHEKLSSLAKREIAYSILHRKPEEILLINSPAFYIAAVFAGLSTKQIEYITKNAPYDYKEELSNLLLGQSTVKAIFEITESMDEDLGENITQNQERVRDVIQYIRDNRTAFEF